MDRIQVAGEVVDILKRVLPKEEIITIAEKINTLNRYEESELGPLAEYIASRIIERSENGKLDKKWKIVKFDDEINYTILEVFDTEEEADAQYDKWDEEYPDGCVDIIHDF